MAAAISVDYRTSEEVRRVKLFLAKVSWMSFGLLALTTTYNPYPFLLITTNTVSGVVGSVQHR